MRLARIKIQNFKGIEQAELVIPKMDSQRPGSGEFLSLVGENNACKSSALEALRLCLPETEPVKPTIDHFPKRKEENGPIEVELEFDEVDTFDEGKHGIRTHVHDNKYRIKKVWSSARAGFEAWAYEPTIEFPTWPSPDTTRKVFEEAGEEWKTLLQEYDARYETFPPRTKIDTREKLKELAVEINSPVAVRGEATWVKNPGGISSNVDSILPKIIFVPAIKKTEEECAVSKTKSAARQIVETMFTKELEGHPAIEQFSQAGEEVKKLFTDEGEGSEIVKRVEQRITQKLERLIPLAAVLGFTPPDIKADLASRTDLEVFDGYVTTKPDHQGHGAQRALILSLLELLAEDTITEAEETEDGFRRSILLLIEDPEIYLHPQMCRKMRDVLLKISRSRTAQVICTTHSPIFLDLADRHDGIAIFRRQGGNVTIFQRRDDLFGHGSFGNEPFGGIGNEEERKRLRMLLDFDPSANEVFFSREVCLVEGDCEIAAIDALGRRMSELKRIDWDKYILVRRNLVIVNCRGKWTIRAFQRVLNGFDVPYRVVHDDDEEGDSGANEAILEQLGGDSELRLVHKPNFEKQIFGESWTRDKPWKAHCKIHQMTDVPEDLVTFLTFVLGRDISGLS